MQGKYFIIVIIVIIIIVLTISIRPIYHGIRDTNATISNIGIPTNNISQTGGAGKAVRQ